MKPSASYLLYDGPITLADLEKAKREWSRTFFLSLQRRFVYGATLPRPELCAFDAMGMDIMEGRV